MKAHIVATLLILSLFCLFLGIWYFATHTETGKSERYAIKPIETNSVDDSHPDPFNMTYDIEGVSVTLKNGEAVHVSETDPSVSDTYRLYKKPIFGDAQNDGDADAALFITKESGGSGTFYYAVLVVNEGGTYRSTNALYVGDRVFPELIAIQGNKLTFTYLDRNPSEPMVTKPHIEKELRTTFNLERFTLESVN